MRKTYIICGLIILAIASLGIVGDVNKMKIIQYGSKVPMEIIEKPNSCLGTKVKWFMKVQYNGEIFAKQISGNYCEQHNIGDKVDLIYLKGEETVLFPDESIFLRILMGALMIIIGSLSLIYGLIKKRESI